MTLVPTADIWTEPGFIDAGAECARPAAPDLDLVRQKKDRQNDSQFLTVFSPSRFATCDQTVERTVK